MHHIMFTKSAKLALVLSLIVLITMYITKRFICPENKHLARLEFDLDYQIKEEPSEPLGADYVYIRIGGVDFPFGADKLTDLNNCVPSGYLWSSAEFQDNGSKYLIICLRQGTSSSRAGNVLLYKKFNENDSFGFTGAVFAADMDMIRVVIPGNFTVELHHNRTKTGQFRNLEILGL